ncbi:NAD(P)H-binding protein [Streptomyces daghestanicus]|nr:NAD(P)H-binding protein [Streptomyces daghestanicus]
MRVVIAGGHGQVALRLERLLAERGDTAVGLVRRPEQTGDVRDAGAVPVLCDLESASVAEVAAHLRDADAVVFAAGAGPGSGAERKDTVDRGAAVLVADAALAARTGRFLMISGKGVDGSPPAGTDPVFAAYLRAKAEADDHVRAHASLGWTILRPGRLTDEPGTGHVTLGPSTPEGSVARDDVAAVLLALLDEPRTAGRTLDLIAGGTPVTAAVRTAADG